MPHVLGVMVGQTLKLKNSDGLLHNVHALPKVNTPFNMAMPANRTEADTKFGKEEGMFLVKCDVHPWMTAYVGVFANPFFAVTGKDGKFSIAACRRAPTRSRPGTRSSASRARSVTVAGGQAGHRRLRVRPAERAARDERADRRPRAVQESHGTPTRSRATPHDHGAHAEHHEHPRARVLAQVRLLDRSQGHRHPVRGHRARCSCSSASA